MRTDKRYFAVVFILVAAALSAWLLSGCGGGGGGGGSNGGTGTATVTGRVLDDIGFPIEGATVAIGSLSDSAGSDGRFSLSGVAKGMVTVVVSASGYLTIQRSYNIIDASQSVGDQILQENPDSPPPPPPPPG